ncbi:hypothetical protein PYCCODRAFT_1429339 [Trametes coccinea BRFM310]|uniref:Uncharacterized protein n=1 Tax=Trametes coccinea (strain BRFM310) TaxID=1353009 RepID=A0A1Y2J733_TRAC3|nr:hypothetical protein PYCCODRAFT_1429339 [Trametes coccinea BRFM310]
MDSSIAEYPSFLDSELPFALRLRLDGYNSPTMFYGFIVPEETTRLKRQVRELKLAPDKEPEAVDGPLGDKRALFLVSNFVRNSWLHATWERVLHQDGQKTVLCLALCSNRPSEREAYALLFGGHATGNREILKRLAKKGRKALGLAAHVQPRWYFGVWCREDHSPMLSEYMSRAFGVTV